MRAEPGKNKGVGNHFLADAGTSLTCRLTLLRGEA